MPYRIIVVEDVPALADAVNACLEKGDRFRVCGCFGSAEEALASLEGIDADACIVDLGLPGMSGIDLLGELKRRRPDMKTIAYTGLGDEQSILSALKAGASGYLVKGGHPDELRAAVEELCLGGAPLGADVSKKLVDHLQAEGERDPFLLTPREKKILMAAKGGASYDEMGDRFHISPHTVHSHMKRIFKKLGASCRRDALDKARKKGII